MEEDVDMVDPEVDSAVTEGTDPEEEASEEDIKLPMRLYASIVQYSFKVQFII